MSEPRMRYFEQEDILHIAISEKPEVGSVELAPNITMALNAAGSGGGVSFPVSGDNRVKQRGGFPKFIPAGESRTKTSDVSERNRVYINLEQCFAGGGPEEVWAFAVGGYQVLHKWLKDHKGRVLSYRELEHYQQMVVGYHGCRALQETLRLMGEVVGGRWGEV